MLLIQNETRQNSGARGVVERNNITTVSNTPPVVPSDKASQPVTVEETEENFGH